ncbi:DNA cytosine methyltransferase [uncultured Negativibacillus sp.]|uniref:DNA cytosine methyltransferase n=1 Tax=uncultured Negativibacillus sp. TaxID=1980696 RepID=UPI0025FF4E41|nr:DNA cytosine methyltransferase [uncultured Negativibacillus sp.]
MKHFGNITQLTGDTVLPVNVIIGGSPCQDLSVAGKRAGLSGERSGLFMEQIRIIKEMHKEYGADYPRFMVWENVPGALSSNKGADFRVVLEKTAKIADSDAVIPGPPKGKWKNSGCIMGDWWSVAWRVFDAQFWGVPQRRRRIALVADFGGQSAPEILFERKGMSGDFEKGRKEKKEVAGSFGESSDQSVYGARENGGRMTVHPLNSSHQNRITDHEVICIQENCIDRSENAGCNGKGRKKDRSYTLNTVDRHAVMCIAHGQVNAEIACNISTTLNCNHEQPIVMAVHQNANGEIRVKDIANTLSTNSNASGRNAPVIFENYGFSEYRLGIGSFRESGGDCGGGSENLCISCGTVAGFNGYKSITSSIQYKENVAPTLEANMPSNVLEQMAVRRLTPLECERLQGFPDGWTDIGVYHDSNRKLRQSSDTSRYKALGNSIAIPPWRWVLQRVCKQYCRPVTMASLFDGIGGFPLIWEEINGKGTCLWASEIEEFPIAVTKKRIGGN